MHVVAAMSIGRTILMRMFGHPRGLLGRLGGVILARTDRRHAAWGVDLLAAQREDSVLDVGCGPGVAVQMLAGTARHVAGIDPSAEMLRQATKRDAAANSEGHVELRQDSSDRIGFEDASFDKVLAINPTHLLPDALAGLREVSRLLRQGGQLTMALTTYSSSVKGCRNSSRPPGSATAWWSRQIRRSAF
jgi:ubiquinone/menaquinone biosynthesis C-methylase UbiE